MTFDDSNNFPPKNRSSGGAVAMRPEPNAALPPHPLDKRWFTHIDGKTYGPYTGHEVRRMVENGQILAADFVCPEGGSEWISAKNDPLLGTIFSSRAQQTQGQPAPVTGNTGTVVQVTNPGPNPAMMAMLLDPGAAGAKSPGVALLLSFFICGAGQMYNGQVGKGVLMLIGCIVLWFVLLGWTIWIWSMIDAYSTAKKMTLRYQQRMLAGMM